MNSQTTWAVISAALLSLLVALFALFPRLLLFLAGWNESSAVMALSPLESFLAKQFSLYLAAQVVALLVNIPESTGPLATVTTNAGTHPLLMPLTIAAIPSAFSAWNTTDVGALASIFSFFSGFTGLFGLWTILFANESSISKTTGADKRTSAFIFGNKAAASKQKAEFKKTR